MLPRAAALTAPPGLPQPSALPLAVPRLLLKDLGPQALLLGWEQVAGATHYRVLLDGRVLAEQWQLPLFSFTDLVPGSAHLIVVEAVAGERRSASPPLEILTPVWPASGGGISIAAPPQTTELPIAAPPLRLESLSPAEAAVGDTLVITGSGFAPGGTHVSFGGQEAVLLSESPSRIEVKVPAAPSGAVNVTVGGQTRQFPAFKVLPVVTLETPPENAVLDGTVELSVRLASGNPVDKVEFFDGDDLIGSVTAEPYSLNWDTAGLASGDYLLSARVTDSEGNHSTTPARQVRLNRPPMLGEPSVSQNPVPGLGYPVRLSVTASDSDNGPNELIYSWSCLAACGSFDRSDGADVVWTAPLTAGGPYTLQVSVTDGLHAPVVKTLTLPVASGTADLGLAGGPR